MLALLLFVLSGAALHAGDPDDGLAYEPGDLIFIKIPTGFGRAVEDITASPASHVGVVAVHESGHRTVVHALGEVQEEPIERYLARGTGAHAVTRFRGISPEEKDWLVKAARDYLGWPYDREFLMHNQAIYCSELVWWAFQDGLGQQPVPLQPMSFGTPGSASYKIMERITGGRIPEGKPGVSPGHYLESSHFDVIHDDLRAPAR